MVLKYISHISTDSINDETGVDLWFVDKEQLDILWKMDQHELKDALDCPGYEDMEYRELPGGNYLLLVYGNDNNVEEEEDEEEDWEDEE